MGKFKGPKGPRIHKPNPKPGGPGVVQPGGTRPPQMDPAKAKAIVDFSAAQLHHINLTMDLYAGEVMRLRQTREQLNQQLQGLVEEYRKTTAARDEYKAELDGYKAEDEARQAPVTTEADLEAERQKVRDEVKSPIDVELPAANYAEPPAAEAQPDPAADKEEPEAIANP